jgi:glutamate-1-semialdehyde 2,1-aminomutase
MEELMRSYSKSELFLARAEKVIPLGSQTFSKSRTQYPLGVSPFFIERASGCRAWDIDGNEYVDFVSSLASVTLGYNDPDVTAAVRDQLESGVIFSLPGTLETEVAERICAMVPCAESVRFGKNGSDATSGAVRVARAYTGCDRIAVCGYHGWQDWFIGSTARNKGVPEAVQRLTHAFAYNDIHSLEALFDKYPGEFAAVILEPMNVAFPVDGFLSRVKEVAARHGALLIFDETITGFRFANGGAQEYFGVTPDLATFGKGLANGFPVSAVAGRRDVMATMEEIFFSFTFGGELLSLAAAKATLDKLASADVVGTIALLGERLKRGLEALIARHDLLDLFNVSGHPAWLFLNVKDAGRSPMYDVKTFLAQELHQQGFLCLGTFNLSYAHTDVEVDRLLEAYDYAFRVLAGITSEGELRSLLRCDPLVPLFKIR